LWSRQLDGPQLTASAEIQRSRPSQITLDTATAPVRLKLSGRKAGSVHNPTDSQNYLTRIQVFSSDQLHTRKPIVAGASLFTLIDDIATILDDVSVMAKVAAKKTAGVLGDDLALNAQQVTGVTADRELPVVWAVAKGSLKNKVILVPAALAISAFAPWAVTPLLMVGGAFLCYEGFEKLAHRFLHSKAEDDAHHADHINALTNAAVDIVTLEKEKVKGAVRTDFILSAEIIAITLGTAADAPFGQQVVVLAGIAAIMTAGVYGLVAGIVKLDDLGLYLSRKGGGLPRSIGAAILKAAPYMMKTLSVVGTAAMFMVGGGILTHGIPAAHHFIERAAHAAGAVPGIGGVLEAVTPTLLSAVAGIVAGAIVLAGASIAGRVFRKIKAQA
jgi:predicted DNA repair protein MutK